VCPKSRECLIETCKKIVGSQQPVLQTIIRIQPLEPMASAFAEHESLTTLPKSGVQLRLKGNSVPSFC